MIWEAGWKINYFSGLAKFLCLWFEQIYCKGTIFNKQMMYYGDPKNISHKFGIFHLAILGNINHITNQSYVTALHISISYSKIFRIGQFIPRKDRISFKHMIWLFAILRKFRIVYPLFIIFQDCKVALIVICQCCQW